jgi:hypothetical protein
MDRIVSDDLDTAAAEKCQNCGSVIERRDHSAQVYYTRKLNRLQTIAIIGMTAATLGLVVLLWNQFQDRGVNTYLNCLHLAAAGVSTPQCEIYRAYIEKHTNVRKPGG